MRPNRAARRWAKFHPKQVAQIRAVSRDIDRAENDIRMAQRVLESVENPAAPAPAKIPRLVLVARFLGIVVGRLIRVWRQLFRRGLDSLDDR